MANARDSRDKGHFDGSAEEARADQAFADAMGTDPAQEPARREGHAWPSTYTRRTQSVTPQPSMVDAADATAWSMPYTDLTMLLMVFFIVMLSIVGPDPSETIEKIDTTEQTGANGTLHADQERRNVQGDIFERNALTVIDGGDGILSGDAGLLPDGAPWSDITEPPTNPSETYRETGELTLADKLAARREAEAAHLGNVRDGATDKTRPAAIPQARPGASSQTLNDDADTAVDDFAREWARRIAALENTAALFLNQTGLDQVVQLNATDRGIELHLPEDMLFPSGSADVRVSGIDLLAGLSPLMVQIHGDVQISGHTDNIPIQTPRFPSNWELSASRAIEVVRLLQQLGVSERKMQAVGHGENRPIASNATPEGRAINRRVTIDVTPYPSARDLQTPIAASTITHAP